MAEARADTFVCDLTLIARSRLLCGLYSHRAVPPRWQSFAKAYCLVLLGAVLAYIYFTNHILDSLSLLYWISCLILYSLAVIVSLWTGDEYIYSFFSQNKRTDITLDSHLIFNGFQKQIKKGYIVAVVTEFVNAALVTAAWSNNGLVFMLFVVPSIFLELIVSHSFTTKVLVMGLFNKRILVLRRRLERYGFRTIGRAPPQPYCQIFDEIWQGLDAVGNPLKLLLFIDLVSNCTLIIRSLTVFIYTVQWQKYEKLEEFLVILLATVTIIKRLFYSFGHVAMLESAENHCDAMAVFTVTQLIKTPSAGERRRMYELLGALAQRGARYRVLRALPLDARLVLQALGFCSAQAIVLVNLLKAN